MANSNLSTWRNIGILVLALAVLLWTVYEGARRIVPTWSDNWSYPEPSIESSTGVGPSDAQYDVSQIVSSHMFGKSTEPVQIQAPAAPETKLQLNLQGLIASADERFARAIISVNNSKPKPYAIGQEVEGTDATLYSVEARRVLLERGNKVESLSLKRADIRSSSSNTGLLNDYGQDHVSTRSEPNSISRPASNRAPTAPEYGQTSPRGSAEIRQENHTIRLRNPF